MSAEQTLALVLAVLVLIGNHLALFTLVAVAAEQTTLLAPPVLQEVLAVVGLVVYRLT